MTSNLKSHFYQTVLGLQKIETYTSCASLSMDMAPCEIEQMICLLLPIFSFMWGQCLSVMICREPWSHPDATVRVHLSGATRRRN